MKVSLRRFLGITLLFPVMLSAAGDYSQRGTAPQRQQGKVTRIVIDPGHGGIDPGTNYGNILEKDITLGIAKKLGALIERNLPDVEVIYTRTSDVYVKVIERSNIANRFNADLFISIHVNASDKNPNASGTSTFVMGYDKSGANLELAMKENEVIKYEENFQTTYENFNPDNPASYIVFQLQQFAHQDQSMTLAEIIQKHYAKNIPMPDRGSFHEGFLVLWRTAMPSVLTEFGFMTNKSDRAYISTEKAQNDAARSLFNAFSEYKSRVEGRSSMVQLQAKDQPETPQGAAQQPAAQQTAYQSSGQQYAAAQISGQQTATLQSSGQQTTGAQSSTQQSTYRQPAQQQAAQSSATVGRNTNRTSSVQIVGQESASQTQQQGVQYTAQQVQSQGGSGQTAPPLPPDPIAVIESGAGTGVQSTTPTYLQNEYSQGKVRTTLPDISAFFADESGKSTNAQGSNASIRQESAKGGGPVVQPEAPAMQGQRPTGVMKGSLTSEATAEQVVRQTPEHRTSQAGQTQPQEVRQPQSGQPQQRAADNAGGMSRQDQYANSSVAYYVQVSALKSPKNTNSPDFKSYRGKVTEKYVPGGSYGYKYMVGGGPSYDEASRSLAQIRREFPDAFLTAFDGDEQITPAEARKRQAAGK